MIPRGCPPARTGPFPISTTGDLSYWCPSCGASVSVGAGSEAELQADTIVWFVRDHPYCGAVPTGDIVGRGIIQLWVPEGVTAAEASP